MWERRVAELERLLAAALTRIGELEKRNAELERLLDQRTRDGKRRRSPRGLPSLILKSPGASRERTTAPRPFADFPTANPTK